MDVKVIWLRPKDRHCYIFGTIVWLLWLQQNAYEDVHLVSSN